MIEKILASFLVSTVVVVTIVIANQNPVKADILKVEAIGNEIVYRHDIKIPFNQIVVHYQDKKE